MLFQHIQDAWRWAISTGSGIFIANSAGNSASNVVLTDKNISTTSRNRYLELPATASTWPGDDTFSVSWDTVDGVTRYRVKMESTTAGTKVKICEDAVNETQAESWLADPSSSSTADVSHTHVVNGTWSEWQEFPEGYSLTRLDFLGDTAEAMNIWVEAE